MIDLCVCVFTPLGASLNLSLAVIGLSVAADVGSTPLQTYQLAVCLAGFQKRYAGSEQSQIIWYFIIFEL